MSKVAIKGNASGTATYTLEAPAGSTDRTLNLPDEAGTVITSVSDIESQVKTATNATGSAPIYACRAWVNFNGTGTVAIREDGNVSSITDIGTGDYQVNFTTAMPDNNFFVVSNSGADGARGTNRYSVAAPKDASGAYVSSEIASTNVRVDNNLVTCAVFR